MILEPAEAEGQASFAAFLPGLPIDRPDRDVEAIRGVFDDRDRFPDREFTVDENRHPPGRRMTQDRGLGLRLVERDDDLVERNGELLEQEPGPERPGRIELVADDELGHGRLPE